MKKGKITSLVGNKIIANVSSSSIGNIYGKKASVDGKRIGRVSEIIGRVDSPYAVIKLSPNIKPDSSSLIGKEITL